MLIVSRKKNEKLVVADQVEITILEVGRNKVRFGIRAPKHIYIETRPRKPEEFEAPAAAAAGAANDSQNRTNVTPFPGTRR
jgi:carbon storage regulator